MEITDFHKKQVTGLMMSRYCGYRNAAPRHKITQWLGMEDRFFRSVCAEIPEIIGSIQHGYYILPLVDPTGEEVKFARAIVEGEERRRMIALYLRQRRQRQAIRKLEGAEKQREFVLT